MKNKTALLIMLLMCLTWPLQSQDVRIDSITNYKSWGWEALVMQNGLITVATVPKIGARVMQYDLGEHSSIYVNPSELGKTYTPALGQWHNFGGYKVWPAPQERWNWPPPPTIDFGVYTGEIVTNTADSAAIFVSSPTEKYTTPGLRCERKLTIFKGSSRVRVDQTLINDGTTANTWSVWDVTQTITDHAQERDFNNFWVYFPINPNSIYGKSGVRTSASSSAWKGEVAPGIYGVQYLPEGKKIFADSHQGWICYVDERDSMAYAKSFELFEGAEYPDQGAHVEVWINNYPYYLEVEVVGPMVELKANGGRTTFTEDWWAAKVKGPILNVNQVGAIGKALALEASTFKGVYGVFWVGNVQLNLLDNVGNIVAQGQNHAVTPFATFNLDETLPVPNNAAKAELRVLKIDGTVIGVLDTLDLTGTGVAISNNNVKPTHFSLLQNYPNPFNPKTTIQFILSERSQAAVKIFDVNGKEVATIFSGELSAGVHSFLWNAELNACGVYFAHLQVNSISQSIKMLLLK